MIWTILCTVLGVFLERRFHPSIVFKDGVWFHYNGAKGARNKTKWF